MRFLFTLIILGVLGYGAYYLNDTKPELKYKALEIIHAGTFPAFEPRFTSRQIMENNRSSLLKEGDFRYKEPQLSFHPHLLMNVKYTTSTHQTKEGVVLWDLISGEMILDTQTWSKTHGFADCINAGADRYEYQILTSIAQNGGIASYQHLVETLNMDTPLLEAWIQRTRKKKLIVQEGNLYRIHLYDPRINVNPSTLIREPLVTKNYKHNERMQRRYSPSQIKKATEAAFGSHFAIRSLQEVFLPIHVITVQSPDGSLHTSHWNALNGKQMTHHLIE